MALDIAGKTAIITGAGSGINLAFATRLLKGNCNVIFADLRLRPEAQAIVDQHSPKKGSGGAQAVFQKTDITEWTDLVALFTTADRAFGGVDIVCPGAGVYEPPFSNFWIPPGTEPSGDASLGGRYAAMDINVTHPIRCTQLAIAHFLKRRRPGVIVHISSIAAQRPILQCPLYVASKFAISGFVRSLAMLETPRDSRLPSIRVNCVAPGVIKTPLWTDNPEKLRWIDPGQDEWVTAEEVAEIMIDLVQKQEYVGGTVLEVGKGQVRQVEVLNDPGPSGAGHSVSAAEAGELEVWDRLLQPSWGRSKL